MSRDKPPRPLRILANLFSRNNNNSNRRSNTKSSSNQRSNDDENKIRDRHFSMDQVLMDNDANANGGGGGGKFNFQHMDSVSTAGGISCCPTTVTCDVLYTELEALHLSRQDNPYILTERRRAESHEDLLEGNCQQAGNQNNPAPPGSEVRRFQINRYASQSIMSGGTAASLGSLMSPPYSPTKSLGDPIILADSNDHDRLIRSPPPIRWPSRDENGFPVSPRSGNSKGKSGGSSKNNNGGGGGGAFSPDSTRSYNGSSLDQNLYVRSQSEEHILSPCKDLLSRSGYFHKPARGDAVSSLSPTRGLTPDLLMTTSITVGYGVDGTSQQKDHHPKIRRNFTLNLSSSRDEVAAASAAFSPNRRDFSRGNYSFHSASSYNILSTPGPYNRRANSSCQSGGPKSSGNQSGGGNSNSSGGRTKKSLGENFFSTWRFTGRNKRQRCPSGNSPAMKSGEQKHQSKNEEGGVKSMESLLHVDIPSRGAGGGGAGHATVSLYSPQTRNKSICSLSPRSNGNPAAASTPLTFTRCRTSSASMRSVGGGGPTSNLNNANHQGSHELFIP